MSNPHPGLRATVKRALAPPPTIRDVVKRALAPARKIPNIYARAVPPAGTALAAPGATPEVRRLERELAGERDPARQASLRRQLAAAKAPRAVAKAPQAPLVGAAKAEVYRLRRELAGELNHTRQVVLRSRLALALSEATKAPAAPPPAVKRSAPIPLAPAGASPKVRDLERQLAKELNPLQAVGIRRKLEFAKLESKGGSK